MSNMRSIISFKNKRVLQPCSKSYRCKCRKNDSCLLDNKFLTPNIIYEVQITSNTNDEHKKNLGAPETSFKERYNNHTEILSIKNI